MFEMPVFSQIPYDGKSATLSVNKGQPLVVSLPRSEISKNIEILTSKILNNKE